MDKRNNKIAAYNSDDIAIVVSKEMSRITKYNYHSQPTAILLAGQPGAGKTVLSSMLSTMLQNDVYLINADEYRRYHPNYQNLYRQYGADSVQMTGAFSGAVTERLIQEASGHKINLIIEGTGRTTEVPHRTAALLMGKGYQVELAVMATRPELSLCSTLLRFYEMNEGGTVPRATAASAHDHVVDVLPDNLDTLINDPVISKISIWNRELNLLYSNENNDVPPSQVLRSYWCHTWSNEEVENIKAAISLLRRKEQQYCLGQGATIDELEKRIQKVVLSIDTRKAQESANSMRDAMEDMRLQSYQEGKAEGKAEGQYKAQKDTAFRMLSVGTYSLEEISAISGLSLEEIQSMNAN